MKDAVTHHTLAVGGRTIGYTSRAGTILLRDGENEPTASVFYVAYTADHTDARRGRSRSSGTAGPARRRSGCTWARSDRCASSVPKDATQPRPTRRCSTTRSRCSTPAISCSSTPSAPAGAPWWRAGRRPTTTASTRTRRRSRSSSSAGSTRNGRWQSPKFLFGESYGTTRAANVVNLLQQDGIAVNGVVLLSSALDYNFLPIGNGPGEDFAYIGYLPTEAAVAWYHHKAAGNPPDLPRFLAEVRAFAGGPYAQALLRGDTLDAATRGADRREAARLHRARATRTSRPRTCASTPTGSSRSCCAREGRNVGRYDGRYSGREIDANATFVDYDPSDTMTAAAFVAAFNHYAHDVLHYRDERPYDVLDFGVNQALEVSARPGLERGQRRRPTCSRRWCRTRRCTCSRRTATSTSRRASTAPSTCSTT